MAALAHVYGLRLSLGVAPLFDSAEFVLHRGERIAFVGANGAGKSTLVRMMAGLAAPDAGEIGFANGATIAFAPQDTNFGDAATLRDYVRTQSVALAGSTAQTPAHAADAALMSFDLDPDRAPVGLSGGEARRASLARAFAADADVLLLDEPTNHLDITAIQDLEKRLAGHRGACLIISHDRRFLERVSTATLWLRQRKLLKHNRGYSDFDAWAEAVELEDERQMARLETQLKAEEHWLQRGVTARRSRNEGRRRKLMAMRATRRDLKELGAERNASLTAARGVESSRLVIDAKGVSKSYGGRAIVTNLTLRIVRGDRAGIVGPNGAGKTTLLELLLGLRDPDAGAVRLGDNLTIAYVDQARDIIAPERTLQETLTPAGGDQVMVRGVPRHVASYAKEFLFTSAQLRQPVSALSGGERNRLALALALAKPANLLVLDEPTNDLDIETLDALEDMLDAYDGTVLIVSHDRAFLDGVTTQIVGAVGGGKWAETPGGWSDFEREHGAALGAPQRASSQTAAAPTHQRAKPNKLSYKEERRTGELEALLPTLSVEIERLEAALAAPDAFARDSAAFERTASRLAAARAEREAAEAEWLEIELKREAIAAQE